MPRRRRSWMRRSRSFVDSPACARSFGGCAVADLSGLATVPPHDHDSSGHMHDTEAEGQEEIRSLKGSEERHDADEQQQQTHERNDAYRSRARAANGDAVEQQPERRQEIE